MAYAAEKLAEWAAGLSFEDIPAEVVERAKLHLLDAVGCGLAAIALGDLAAAREAARELNGRPEATVLGVQERLSAGMAAFANGATMHALDFDDTHELGLVHSSAVVAPVVLACAEAADVDGAEAIAATVAAFETSARVGIAGAPHLHVKGFHPTSVCGVFAAAVAAGKLRGLSALELRNALGIAGSQASGILEFLADGSQTKPIHPGWAALGGIMAASLAAHGATGPASVFEGRFGLLRTHLEQFDEAALTAGLGETWQTLAICFKPYPACHCTHTPLDSLAAIVAEDGIGPDEVEEIVARVPDEVAVKLVLEPAERKVRPATPYEAKFSLPYCLASLLVRGRVGVESFTEEAIGDERVLGLTPRVRYVVRPFSGGNELSGAVAVKTRDGRSLERAVLDPRGGSKNPMSAADVLEKFRGNARLTFSEETVERLVEAFQRLEHERVAAAMGLLAAPSMAAA